MNPMTITKMCGKCGGSGHLTGVKVDNGVCWGCAGSGEQTILATSARATERRQLAAKVRQNEATNALKAKTQATIRAFRAAIGCRANLFGTLITSDYPPVEHVLRTQLNEVMILVRDQQIGLNDAVEMLRENRIGDVFGANRHRGNCVACGNTVQAKKGVTLRVRSEWHVLCMIHAPEAA